MRRPDRLRHPSAVFLGITGVVAAGVFLALAAPAPAFIQDDAYISFRYVRNVLDGEGLVFNSGERVEGYTNFLWIMMLVIAGKLGFGIESSARWLGLLCSAGTATATVYLARRGCADFPPVWRYLLPAAAALWVVVNPALTYWSGAGLETSLFLLLVTLAVERAAAGSALGWGYLVLATLARPEGALVFAVVYVWYVLPRPRARHQRWWLPLLLYVAPLAPFGLFKLIYYGSLLPNPFYAKTGFSPEYWRSGIDYVWLFLQHFGMWGLLPLAVVVGLFRAGFRSATGLFAALWIIYALYVISIGGDVLRAHRFFVPLWPVFAVAAIAGVVMAGKRWLRHPPLFAAVISVTFIAIAGYQLRYSKEYFRSSRVLEFGLVEKMLAMATYLTATDTTRFSVAATTIGRLGYALPWHTIIDMLGLTDTTVARHPEDIPGLRTTWKERKFNAGYVLSRDPQYILFSTDVKPSAPAERALYLHSQFRQNYFAAMYPTPREALFYIAHKRKGPFAKPDSLWSDPSLGNAIHDGWTELFTGDRARVIDIFSRMKRSGPRDFPVPDDALGLTYLLQGKTDLALVYADSAIAIDPYAVTAMTTKMGVLWRQGRTPEGNAVRDSIKRICPWLDLHP